MSNWFMFDHIHNQIRLTRKKKGLISNFLVSLLLISLGVWLIHLLLASQGVHPLKTDQTNHQAALHGADFSPSVLYWQEEIEAWAISTGLSPLLIATVMQIESCGDPLATSTVGAQGLFQVMPYHFQPGEDMLDPQTNAQRGLANLHESLQIANNNIQLTLAGYNGGHSQINSNPTNWPTETQRYVHWGYSIFQDALQGKFQGKALSAWLRTGGWQLCEQAEINLGLH